MSLMKIMNVLFLIMISIFIIYGIYRYTSNQKFKMIENMETIDDSSFTNISILNEKVHEVLDNKLDTMSRNYSLMSDINIENANNSNIGAMIDQNLKPFIRKDKNLNFIHSNVNGDKYKCSFKNMKPRDYKFAKTILDPSKNKVISYETDTMNDEQYKLNDVNLYNANPYVDQDDPLFSPYLNIPNIINYESIKDNVIYYNVPFEYLIQGENQLYEICTPEQTQYNTDDDPDVNFRGMFPCGSVYCEQMTESESVTDDVATIDFNSTENKVDEYLNGIIKYEHESSILEIMKSSQFIQWLRMIFQDKKKNKQIQDKTYIDQYEISTETTDTESTTDTTEEMSEESV